MLLLGGTMIRVALTGKADPEQVLAALQEVKRYDSAIVLCVEHDLPVPWDGVVARYRGGEPIPDADVCVAFERTPTALACEASGAQMHWRIEMPKHEFLWFDLETTGLDPACGKILEFAVVLCEDAKGYDFAITDCFSSAVHHDVARDIADPFVQQMHDANGLWADVASSDVSLADADAMLEAYAMQLSDGRERSITLAGNSVHFDLAWCRVWLPGFARFLSHRVFDVSTLMRAAEAWTGRKCERITAHRALADVQASIAYARAARKALMGGAP